MCVQSSQGVQIVVTGRESSRERAAWGLVLVVLLPLAVACKDRACLVYHRRVALKRNIYSWMVRARVGRGSTGPAKTATMLSGPTTCASETQLWLAEEALALQKLPPCSAAPPHVPPKQHHQANYACKEACVGKVSTPGSGSLTSLASSVFLQHLPGACTSVTLLILLRGGIVVIFFTCTDQYQWLARQD